MSVSGVTKEKRKVEGLQKEKMSLEILPTDPEIDRRKAHVDEELAIALHNVNATNFEKEIENLTNTKKAKGKSAAIFKLR